MATLPSINKADFFVADDIREEQGTKKLTVLGLFAGGDILFPKDTTPGFVIPKLAFFVRFKDGDGKWSIEWEIRAPDNSVVGHSNATFELKKDPHKIHLLILTSTIKVPLFGIFKLVVKLGSNELEFPFSIDTQQ